MFKRSMFFRVAGPTILVSLVLLGSCTAVAIYLSKQQATTAMAYGENVDSHEAALLLELSLKNLLVQLQKAERDPGARGQMGEYHQHVKEFLSAAGQLADKPEERRLVDEIAAGFARHLEAWRSGLESAGEPATGRYDGAMRVLETEMLPESVRLRKFNEAQSKSSQAQHRTNVERMIWGLTVVGGIGSLAGIVIGYGVARGLRQSIYRLGVRVRDAAGKLGQDLPIVTLAEDGDLHGLSQQMQTVVHEVERVVERLQQREREVLRAEQLAAVGQVAAGVAHELRNPLTSVKMLVQKNRRQAGSHGLPAENLAIIEQEIRRMERCLQTFLDFARPPKPERHPVDLASIVERTFALIEGRARKQHVRLEFTHLGAVMVEVDPEQIHQLLINLALNGLDAMPNGGDLQVELCGPAGSQVELRLLDTGSGISPDVLPRLFEPFMSSKETGVGLGLVISRRIAEEHAGTLSAYNRPEGGACFLLRLPTA